MNKCVLAVVFLFCFCFFANERRILFFPKHYPQKRGDFASTFNTSDYSILDFVSRFNMVEIGGVGDIAPENTIAFLRKRGVKTVFCYDWMPAVYYYPDEENYPFVNWVYENRYTVSLNPEGPFPHTESEGYDFAREYYLDFLNQTLIEKRLNFLAGIVLDNGYNGLFFDWGSGVFILEPEYEAIRRYFTQKHPDQCYLDSVKNFYSALRERCNQLSIEVFTNQGYRNAENVLPYVNYDMAESYIVGFDYYGRSLNVEGYGVVEIPETQYFPVSEEGNESFYDTLYYLDLINSLIKQFGGRYFKGFVFMDYAAPEFVFNEKRGNYIAEKPRNAIFLSFASAKLINQTSFLEVSFDPHLEFSNVYFVNLGGALGDNYQLNQQEHYAIRFYQNGFVMVYFGNSLKKDILIPSDFLPQYGFVYDVFSDRWLYINNHKVKVRIKTKIDSLTGKIIPAGRVFVYEKREIALEPKEEKKGNYNIN